MSSAVKALLRLDLVFFLDKWLKCDQKCLELPFEDSDNSVKYCALADLTDN